MLSIKRDNIRFYPNLRFELKESLKRKRRGVCDRGLGIYEATDFDYLEDDEERSSTRFAIDG